MEGALHERRWHLTRNGVLALCWHFLLQVFNFSHEAANGRTSSIAQDIPDSCPFLIHVAAAFYAYLGIGICSILEEIMGFSQSGEQVGGFFQSLRIGAGALSVFNRSPYRC